MKSCKEVHKLFHSDEELGLFQKLSLKIHTSMCKHCDAYKRHLKLVRQGVAKWVSNASDVDIEEVRELERKVLKKNSKNMNSSFDE